MAGKANAPNWKKIKAEYVRGGTSYGKLAKKYGLSKSAVAGRAKRENWIAMQREVVDETRTKAVRKIADSEADLMAKLSGMQADAAQALYEKLLANIRNFPDGVGTRTVRETVDVKEVTLEDGTVKKFPLRSSFTNDLEAIAHVMATLGRLYGLDAGSALQQARLEMERAQGDAKPDDRPIIIDARPEKRNADAE